MPVIFIDDWIAEEITVSMLEKRRIELAPYFSDERKRRLVLEKMTSKYWYDKIVSWL